jgi:hypothetical protein
VFGEEWHFLVGGDWMASNRREDSDSREDNRWQARPVLAALLQLLVIAIPILCSLMAAYAVSSLLPAGTGTGRWGYRAVTVGCALAAAALA